MILPYLKSYFQDKELKLIVKSVLGTDNPEIIQALLERAVTENLQSFIAKLLFVESSIGVVFGLLLANNQSIVLKVYSPKIKLSYLEKMHEIQNIFYDEGFPAPKVITPLFKLGRTHAGFYQLITGQKADAHRPEIRSELAKYLAQFSAIVDKHRLSPMENFLQQGGHRKLWPIPHKPLFDFRKTMRGAGWIAKRAQAAKKILMAAKVEKKLAHTDWGTKNALFQNDKLVGIFDWDSLGAMSELQMLGQAAAQFTADWDSGNKVTPTPEEGRQFVALYQEFRKKTFTPDEYKIISAAADYLIAIIARFEHAGSNPTIHPYQDLLKSGEGTSFLF